MDFNRPDKDDKIKITQPMKNLPFPNQTQQKLDTNVGQKKSSSSVISPIEKAYQGFLQLEKTKGVDRSRGVQAMATALEQNFDEILEANTLDLETSREMAVPEIILHWLKLTPERLANSIEILAKLAKISDPLEVVAKATYQLDASQTYCQRMPLGVVALIYEAFPDLAAIAAGLCLKTGNSLVARGGSEASHSNNLIAQTLTTAIEEADLPSGCLAFLSPDEGCCVQDIVLQDQYINLVIPYGRPSLIEQVSKTSNVPVLRSAIGNCYLYWSVNGDLDLVRGVITDSHQGEPDAVNAIEKVILTSNHKLSSVQRLLNNLQEQGYKLRGDQYLVKEFPEQLFLVEDSEWDRPYLDKVVAFKMVESLSEGIDWINQHSSGHANCIVTDSYKESRKFSLSINSSLVYLNSSPRFYRNPQGGDAIFLGMSNQKGYRRGLIGLETLTTLKQVVQGYGR